MNKLTSAINNLYQRIKGKRVPNTSKLLLLLCGVIILFHKLTLKKFDDWITDPFLSTITSSILLDGFWAFCLILTIVSVINGNFRRFFYCTYWFLSGLIFVCIYLHFRLANNHYSFVGFELYHQIKYADIFAFILFVFILGYYTSRNIKVVATTNLELKQVQRMINSYLDMDTNYALLLNGKRGTGKTHFVKNRLLDQIRATKADENDAKHYIPIYISLYGLKSIDEIYSQLSMSLTPHLKEDTVSSDSYLAKILLRGMLNITRAGNIDDYLKDFQKTRKNNISISNFVMIFDDLDRISKELTIDELIGFINTMVEHENNKVIIVADEVEVENQELYKQVREKTIGSIVEYPDNFETAFDEILQSKYSRIAPSFYEHLMNVKPIIYNQFQIGNCVSLRTLIYFLNHYRKVYEALDNMQKKEPREIEVQQRKMHLTLKFTCAACIEFKSGTLSYRFKRGIDDMLSINKKLTDDFTKQMWRNTKAGEINDSPDNLPLEEMEYPQQFVTKYFRTWEYHYLKSAYDFVTGGNELDKVLLLSELQFIDDKIANPSDSERVYNRLSTPQVFDLNNQEYQELSEKMLSYAENGDYPLQKYLNVFAYLLRFPDIAEYRSNILAKRLVNAIKDNQSKYSYDTELDFTLRDDNSSPKNSDWDLLKGTLRELNNATEALKEERRTENLYGLFLSNSDEFYDRCFKEFFSRPVFHSWNFPTFYEDFLNLKPSAIPAFTRFIKTRYKHAGNEKWIEKHFIEDLINKLSVHSDEEINFKKLLLDELRQVLSDIHSTYTKIGFSEVKK